MPIAPTADPDSLGFDPARLSRLGRHFAGYVDRGLLPGYQVVVARGGEVVHASTYGRRDREADRPVDDDTLWRIYSMTKPVTAVAAMILWEEGRFELTDEVSRWLPAFGDVRVFDKGSALTPFTVPAAEPVRMWHLFTHTSGLTYGFLHTSPVDAMYRAAGYEWTHPEGVDLAGACEQWAALPLLFQPGTAWGYSVATDVLGRVVEVISGQRLDEFVQQRILDPLGMRDTRWWVDPDSADRLAALYVPNPRGGISRYDKLGDLAFGPPKVLSGGAGLVSTAADYHRFTQMLRRGGELSGQRLLGSRTVRLMTRNHLPGGADLGQLSTGGFAESIFEGVGFGLGFAVLENPVPGRTHGTPGEYYWGGAASTAFWVDPIEDVTCLFFTQVLPSSTYPIRSQLRQLVYSALVD